MSIREASPPGQYPTLPAGSDRRAPWACRESTEEAYVAWIRRCIVFHNKRHPAEMGASAARVRRGCTLTQISISSGRILVRRVQGTATMPARAPPPLIVLNTISGDGARSRSDSEAAES